jgi:integrase
MGTLSHLHQFLPTAIVDRQAPWGAFLVDEFHEYMIRRRRSPHTIRLRLFYVQKFAAWYGQDLATTTERDLETYIYLNPDWSENTQATADASLRAFYGWATREGLITLNPARELPAIHPHRRRQRIASEEAIRHAIQCDNLSDRAMVMLGAECGLRVSEISHLNRSNRDGEWLHVVGKGGQERTLHLSPELAAILDEIEATTMCCGHYFPGQSRTQSIHPSTAWRHITAVLDSNPHSLRRRAGTVVYRQSGHDIRLAQYFLGHKHSATTEAYLDIRDDDLVRAGALTRLAA